MELTCSSQELPDIKLSKVPQPVFPPPSSKIPPHLKNDILVLVRVKYTSPTHVDTLYARGLHQNNHSKLVHPPFILGTEFAGVVQDVAHVSLSPSTFDKDDTKKFQRGDCVWGTALGSFAPFVVCTSSSIHRIPTGLQMWEAAGLGASTAPVSYGALVSLAGLKRGETCLVHAAAGGLGIAAVMIAKAVGANVIGTVGSQAKAKMVTNVLSDRHGNTAPGNGVVLYDQDGWEKEVRGLTNGRGVDVVFDTVGLVAKSIRCCRFGGRIVVVGFVGRGEGKRAEMEMLPMNRILLKGVKVMGYRYGETSRQNPEETKALWNGFDKLLATGTLKPVVHKQYKGLRHVREALEELSSRKVCGKIVIEIDETEDAIESEHNPRTSKM